MKKRYQFAILASLLPSVALAHPGHLAYSSLLDAFIHPLTGVDHLVAMLAVGVVASQQQGAKRFHAPGWFLLAMVFGLAMAGANLFGHYAHVAEWGVMASLWMLGAVLLYRHRLNVPLLYSMIALAGLAHGLTHGVELNQSVLTGVVVLLATALIHVAGLWIGGVLKQRNLTAWFAWATLATGLVSVVA